jgi:hypothetical protein
MLDFEFAEPINCALRIAGSFGSGFSDARSLSPISRDGPTVYLVNVNSVAHDGAFGSASTPCTPPATDRGTAGDFE